MSDARPEQPDSDHIEELLELIDAVDARRVIERFDADFDVPGKAATAVAVLNLQGAHEPVPVPDEAAPPEVWAERYDRLAIRLGAHWCEIVHNDVRYDLRRALTLLAASRADAEELLAAVVAGRVPPDATFVRYALTRWYDGAGRIRYRLGDFAGGRELFGQADRLARRSGLWWALPDIRSNYLRLQFEEAGQVAETPGAPETKDQTADRRFRSVVRVILELAARHGVPIENGQLLKDASDHRARELARGYVNAQHNLAVLHKGDNARSLAYSLEATRVAEAIDDKYRIAQCLNHRAILSEGRAKTDAEARDEAIRLFTETKKKGWVRGTAIADQHLAILEGGVPGAERLSKLLSRSLTGEAANASSGLDVALPLYMAVVFEGTAAEAVEAASSEQERQRARELLAEARAGRLEVARLVREVVALPAYKRSYSRSVRGVYLQTRRRAPGR